MVTGVGWHGSIYNLPNHLTFVILMTSRAGGEDSSSSEKLQALTKHQQLNRSVLYSTAWGKKLSSFEVNKCNN